MSTAEFLAGIVAERRDQIYLVEARSGASFTYGEFDHWARVLAGDLRARGVPRGARVGLLLGNGPAFAVLYFACLYAGVTAVPVNAQLAPQEVAFILAQAGLTEVVYDATTCALVASVRQAGWAERWVAAEPAAAQGDDRVWPLSERRAGSPVPPDVQDDALFSLNFTSGTTSQPKGVPHRVGALWAAARAFNAHTGIDASHRFYHVLPMAYMAGFLNTLLCPFAAGGSVVTAAPFSPAVLLQFWGPVRAQGVNALWLVPTMLAALLRADRDPEGRRYCADSIRLICVGTAPLPGQLQADFEAAYGARLHESYGLSETLFVSGQSPRLPARLGSVGQPLAGIGLRMVGEHGQEVPEGEEGEILVQAPWSMPGYFDYGSKQPQETGSTWFPSGDVGRRDTEGYLFITARKKDLIIRGGQNISPRAVEEVLEAHPAVLQAAVVGVPHAFYGEEVVAVLVLRAAADLVALRSELEARCRAALSPAALPTRFHVRSALPASVTGKVQKNRLRDWVAAGAPADGA